MIQQAKSAFGNIDVLILNAGISMHFFAEEAQQSAKDAIMNTDFWGPVYTAEAALPYLKYFPLYAQIITVGKLAVRFWLYPVCLLYYQDHAAPIIMQQRLA